MKYLPKTFAALLTGTLLFSAVPAQACQLVCMQTNLEYTGNLGGLAGADAKCAAEFPGFKFARSSTILANLPSTANNQRVFAALGSPNNGPNGGIYEITLPYNTASTVYGVAAVPNGSASSSVFANAWVHGSTNCANWTIAGGAGNIVGGSAPNCFTTHPLLCCNM